MYITFISGAKPIEENSHNMKRTLFMYAYS